MSHTTSLPDGWVAIHDNAPGVGSVITFREINVLGIATDLKIPYSVLFEFVVEMIRAEKISKLEGASLSEVIEI